MSTEAVRALPWPVVPYPCQLLIVQKLLYYFRDDQSSSFEHRPRILVLESPTGTGKTLCILMAACHHLLSQRVLSELERRGLHLLGNCSFSNKDGRILIARREAEVDAIQRAVGSRDKLTGRGFAAILREAGCRNQRIPQTPHKNVAMRVALEEYGDGADVDGTEDLPRVIICSRTHQQLSQFIEQFRELEYATLKMQGGDRGDRGGGYSQRALSLVHLGSRAKLCCHQDVSKSSAARDVNSFCEDQRRNGCEPYKKREEAGGLILAVPLDIEELSDVSRCKFTIGASVGLLLGGQVPLLQAARREQRGSRDRVNVAGKGGEADFAFGCGYYGGRVVASRADILLCPYDMLLSRASRTGLGLTREHLANTHIIIDEGHNLRDCVNASFSSESLTTAVIENCLMTLFEWRTELSEEGRPLREVEIEGLFGSRRGWIKILPKIVSLIEGEFDEILGTFSVLSMKHIRTGIEHLIPSTATIAEALNFINERKICERVKKWKSSRKENFSTLADADSVFRCREFLERFCDAYNEDEIVLDRAKSSAHIRCRTADLRLLEIAKETKSVTIMGGTMRPKEEYDTLIRMVQEKPNNGMSEFFAGNGVTTKANYFIRTFHDTRWTFRNRKQENLRGLLARLVDVAESVKRGGLAVFVPSKAFLGELVESSGSDLGAVLPGRSVHVESTKNLTVFEQYQADVASGGRPILFCVMGGRLSEGTDFANDLLRCLVIVGVPYAPVIDGADSEAKTDASIKAMKKVNQTLGRAVRHQADWCSILFMDERYEERRTREMLPHNIQQYMISANCHWREEMSDFYRIRLGEVAA